jgi:DnaJ-class molecular chaperone
VTRDEALILFQLPREYTMDILQTRYRQLRRDAHPDKQGDKDLFIKIQQAYQLLCRPGICPLCDGRGYVREKEGAVTKKVQCPRCWG